MNSPAYIIQAILNIKNKTPMLVAFDGVDAAGKTIFADRVNELMIQQNVLSPVRISIDTFHNPEHIRLQRGALSPEGYFYDSFNYDAVFENIITPVKENQDFLIPGLYDYKREVRVAPKPVPITEETVVLFDGIFMHRYELFAEWDLSVFLDVSFETVLERALSRDLVLFGSEEEVRRKYMNRYMPGEKIYLEQCHPKDRADIVIDNNDFNNPEIIKWLEGNNYG